MREALIRKLPPGAARFAGKLEHSVPVLAPLIRRTVRSLQNADGTIAHGEGRGLRFNPAGTNPGYALGTSEPLVQKGIAELLAPGATFYDIGANVGFFSVIAARRVGPAGRVYAFEPLPENASALARNVALNDLANVVVVEAALGAQPGRGALAVTEEAVQAHLADTETGVSALGTVNVAITTVDAEVAAGRRPPQVVKIDVEGAELAVLQGMRRTLVDHRPTIVCELHGTNEQVCDYLEALGYRLDAVERVESIRTAGSMHLRAR